MRSWRQLRACLPTALLACACAGTQPGASAQTPADTSKSPATTTTSDGEVVGADRTPPAQKLDQGVSIDTNRGVKPAAQPPAE